MQNFTFHNPVRIVFGRGAIAELKNQIPATSRVLLVYGGGSIKCNGVHDQVLAALTGRTVLEFGGIEPNPRYETCMQAVALARQEKIDFLLAVGGGSVLDATKFIAAAILYTGAEPWDIVAKGAPVATAVPLGVVLTLPATGSEMNCYAVISREATQEKRAFLSAAVYPRFSILDPETTFTLPPRQVANGIVDTFVHVTEQYLTYADHTPLQNRFAEAILLTLLEEAPKVTATPRDYDVRANLMWCATMALNGTISIGAPQDWATHDIGHELTALYGIDHAQSLAVVLPGVLRYRFAAKQERLVQYGERVWNIRNGSDQARAEAAIAATETFFASVNAPTRLRDYKIDAEDAATRVPVRLAARGARLGEHGDITPDDVAAILRSRA